MALQDDESELKRALGSAGEQLRDSEAYRQLLTGSLTHATWETDAAGVVVTDSPSWRAYTGQTREEWLGYGWLDAIHPDDLAYAERQWREAMAAQRVVDAEFRLRAPDGGWRWTNVRAAPVLDDGGDIAKWVGRNIDIDARKRAEAALRASEDKYRTLFESIDEGFCVLELLYDEEGEPRDCRYVQVNPAFLKQTGQDDPTGKLGSEYVPASAPMWLATYDAIVRSGDPVRFEQYHPDSGRWYSIHASIIGERGSRLVASVFADITARKLAENALRESEERFRALATAGAVSIYRMSPDWRLMYQLSSDSLADTTEPIEDWVDKYILEDDLPTVRAAIERAIRTKSLFQLEHRVLLADGSIGWVMSRAVPLQDPDGTVIEWFGAGSDVTLRRRAEEALRDNEARQRAVLSQAPMAIAFTGREGQILFRNAMFDHLWGRAAHDTTARSYSDVYEGFHLDGKPIASQDWPGARAVLKGETIHDEVLEIVNLQGQRVPCSFDAGPIRDAGQDVIGAVVMFRDVTEERRAQRALREGEERLRQFGEASSDVLWTRDAETFQWTYLTPAFETIYGIDRATALAGDNMAGWVDLIEPEDRAHAVESLERVREGERVAFEYRIRRPSDGAVRWLRNTDFPIRDPGGRVLSIGGIGRDVTEAKETADRMQVLVSELQHRTRNLMGVVRSTMEATLRASTNLDEFAGRYRDRLAALSRVQGLLSRLDTGDRVAFDELVTGEFQALGALDRVELDGPRGVALRSSTVQTFAMALHELATNAAKYGALAQRSGRLAVTWRLEPVGPGDRPWLHVDWRESGVTMPPAGSAAQGTGQGRQLIERALPYQLGAKTTFVMGPDGVRCSIAVPVSTRTAAEENGHDPRPAS